MSPILDIFEYQLSAAVFECMSLAFIVAYAGIAVWAAWHEPTRLPVDIVRRAL